ncbi:hypothetical protein D3C85_992570 [compost metagenome]
MVAGENHRLLAMALDAFFGDDGLLLDVQVNEPSKDVHQAVAHKHLAPQVGGTHIALNGWVACTVVMPKIERQEECVLALQLGRHEDQFGVHGKMHQATLFEGEQQLLGVALKAVLVLCVFHVPARGRHRVLQLKRGHGQAIYRQHYVGDGPAFGVDLSHDSQAVVVVTLGTCGVESGVGRKVGQPHRLAHTLETLAQDRQRPFGGKLFHQAIQQHRRGLGCVELGQSSPDLRLRLLHKGNDICRE